MVGTWSVVGTLAVLAGTMVRVDGEHDANILHLYRDNFTGDGTYYGKTASGMCAYNIPSLPPVASHVDKLVALNAEQMYGSSGCGLCFRVTGSGKGAGNNPITGTFIAYAKDVCPECRAGALDLAEDGDGRWTITIQAVQCPVGNTAIEYRFEGSNDWYLKMQVRNERMPATTVDMYQPQGQFWLPLKRSLDGFWLFPEGNRAEKPIQLPFKVRLHAPNGNVLEDTIHAPSMGFQGIIRGDGVQFPLDPTLPTA